MECKDEILIALLVILIYINKFIFIDEKQYKVIGIVSIEINMLNKYQFLNGAVA